MRAIQLISLAAILFATTATAGARDDLDAFSKGLQTLQGQFSQQVFGPNGELKETSSGRVALSAPDLFRWQYVKPYAQLIVADGENVWVHDPDLQQVTVRAQGAADQASPLAALLDPALRESRFEISEAGTSDGLEWLQLTPRNGDEGGFQTAKLGFHDNQLKQMQAVDALGQRTVIVFSDLQRNPELAADTFTFTPPEGVDVIR